MFKTPILFLIFNRPEVTQRVFNKIREIKPKYLYVAADGPRKDIAEDKEKCIDTRKIIDTIDWDCEIKTLFREDNLGCKNAISSAIDWFFDNVEEGIILEDDCLPSISFFNYCSCLLEKYRNNEKIMHIAGTNPSEGSFNDDTYHFTVMPEIWGWATWGRAWQHYDVNMKSYLIFKKENKIKKMFKDKYHQMFWIKAFDEHLQHSKSWANIWNYIIFNQNGLCINPNKNLISNIGFGKEAVHTTDENSHLANRTTYELKEIKHPEKIEISFKAINAAMKSHRSRELELIEFNSKNKIEKEIIRLRKKIVKRWKK